MQEILDDDDDIKNKLLAPLEKELGGLQFWLFFSGILFLIVGALGVFLVLYIMKGPIGWWDFYSSHVWSRIYAYSYDWLPLLRSVGTLLAFMVTFLLAYMHFKCVKNSKTFCEDETEENFKKLLITYSKDWRLFAFVFIFLNIAFTPAMTYNTYLHWYQYYYPEPVDFEDIKWRQAPRLIDSLETD